MAHGCGAVSKRFLFMQTSARDASAKLCAGAMITGLPRALPLGEMARVVALLGCDRGLHQHVPLRVQSVPVVGGVNVLVDTAM